MYVRPEEKITAKNFHQRLHEPGGLRELRGPNLHQNGTQHPVLEDLSGPFGDTSFSLWVRMAPNMLRVPFVGLNSIRGYFLLGTNNNTVPSSTATTATANYHNLLLTLLLLLLLLLPLIDN